MHSRHRARSLSLSLSLCLSVSLQKVNGFQKNKKYTHTHTNNNISTTLKHQSDTKNLLEHVILAALASEKAQLGAAAAAEPENRGRPNRDPTDGLDGCIQYMYTRMDGSNGSQPTYITLRPDIFSY
jgi:hypothetical protein